MSTGLLSLAVDAGIDFSPNATERRTDPRPALRHFLELVGLDWSRVLEAYDSKGSQDFLVWLKNTLGAKREHAYVWFEIGFLTLETFGVALRQDAPLDLVLGGYRAFLERAGVLISERDEIGRLIQSLPSLPHDRRHASLNSIREVLRQRATIIEAAQQKQSGDKPLADRIIGKLKDNPLVAVLVVAGILVVALGSFTDALEKITQFRDKWTKSPVSVRSEQRKSSESQVKKAPVTDNANDAQPHAPADPPQAAGR